MRKLLDFLVIWGGLLFIIGGWVSVGLDFYSQHVLADHIWQWVALPGLCVGVLSMLPTAYQKQKPVAVTLEPWPDEAYKPLQLLRDEQAIARLRELYGPDPITGRTAAHAYAEYIESRRQERLASLTELPDEAYLALEKDFEKHYFELEQKIIQELSPHFGGMMGPHPIICGECMGGPCEMPDICSKEYLWTEPADYLLELANEKLSQCSTILPTSPNL